MTPTAHFFSSTHTCPSELPLLANSILFHGDPVDERGSSAIALGGASLAEKMLLTYDFENMTTTVGSRQVSADRCVELLQPHVKDRNVVLEATTLGFAELFCAVRVLITLQVSRFQIIYVEPMDYSRTSPGGDSFELSELISGYHPIPHSVVDLSSDEVEAGVFFLGYEPERLARALEEYQMISSKEVKVVFGVPAYQAGWELNSIVPHLHILSEQQKFNIAFCAANDPGSAFDCLEKTRQSLTTGHRMFVAPIGTKPCGIAAAVFASLFPSDVGLLYDHPQKKKRRSKGVNVWHRYAIRIDY